MLASAGVRHSFRRFRSALSWTFRCLSSGVLQGTHISRRMSYTVGQWSGRCLWRCTHVTASKHISFLQFNLKEKKYDGNLFCLAWVRWPRPASAVHPHPSVNPGDEILCNWSLSVDSPAVLFKSFVVCFFFFKDCIIPIPVAACLTVFRDLFWVRVYDGLMVWDRKRLTTPALSLGSKVFSFSFLGHTKEVLFN